MAQRFMGKVVIVAEHASFRFGGEAAIPLHYFQRLRAAGVPVWLVVHARTRDELSSMFPGEPRILFVPDSIVERTLWRMGKLLPRRIEDFTTGYLMRLWSQIRQRGLVKKLVRDEGISVVHQPIPVAPKEPSLMFALGAPLVIGPMNGGMEYPPAFQSAQLPVERIFVRLARSASHAMNRLMPGKLRAAAVVVANERSRLALPRGISGQVLSLCENGIDRKLWTKSEAIIDDPRDIRPFRLLFMGRLVDWKAVDLLLEAMGRVRAKRRVELTIAGDGPERNALEAQAARLGLTNGDTVSVEFIGWKTQTECAALLERSDALVLPSLYECGGAVVLEAMASARAVIATDWGGPADYLDPTCGILVPPSSPDTFKQGLRDAIEQLANNPGLAAQLGSAGRDKAIREFDWDKKIEAMRAIYAGVAAVPRPADRASLDRSDNRPS